MKKKDHKIHIQGYVVRDHVLPNNDTREGQMMFENGLGINISLHEKYWSSEESVYEVYIIDRVRSPQEIVSNPRPMETDKIVYYFRNYDEVKEFAKKVQLIPPMGNALLS